MLKCIFLLIDIRHDPSANDKMMYDWIVSNGYKPVIIATKLDKLKRSQIQKHLKMVREGLGLEKEDQKAGSKKWSESVLNLEKGKSLCYNQ